MNEQPEKLEIWAVVEIMGHVTFAGLVTEETRFGTVMLRVDVPETESVPAFTKFFGGSSIYSVTPCSEEYARAVATHLDKRPLNIYIPQLYKPDETRQIAPPDDDEDARANLDFGFEEC